MFVGFQRFKRLFVALAFGVMPCALFAGELTGIRLSSGPVATRIVFDLDRAAEHRIFELANPNRLVIDLDATLASQALRLPTPKGRVRSVRTGVQPGGKLRVVLDLTEAADSKSFVLGPDGQQGHRLVVDLSDPVKGNGQRRITTDDYTGRDVVVVIDAGHGGHEPGAVHYGIREKDVVLAISRRLADQVNQQRGFRAVLVRDDDRYVEFDDRLRVAHEAQADLFISIHADSVGDSRVTGATIYSIEDDRAVSETARRVADRENSADLIGGVKISDKDDTLARVLLGLVQEGARSRSDAVGQSLIEQMSRVVPVRKRTVEGGNFVILTSPDIPSVLVETAYLSNPDQARDLNDPAFQNLIARAMFAGVIDYFRDYSPPDSWVARNPPPVPTGPIRHVIARGETLSEIAERYRISLRELRRSNGLSGDRIRIGQVLTIPIIG